MSCASALTQGLGRLAVRVDLDEVLHDTPVARAPAERVHEGAGVLAEHMHVLERAGEEGAHSEAPSRVSLEAQPHLVHCGCPPEVDQDDVLQQRLNGPPKPRSFVVLDEVVVHQRLLFC